MYNTTHQNLKLESLFCEYLSLVMAQKSNKLRSHVAEILLTANETSALIKDILAFGCASGCISSLVYRADTHEFYDTFYSEIEELRENYDFLNGSSLVIKGDLKNCLAWFSFQEVTRQIAYEMGIK